MCWSGGGGRKGQQPEQCCSKAALIGFLEITGILAVWYLTHRLCSSSRIFVHVISKNWIKPGSVRACRVWGKIFLVISQVFIQGGTDGLLKYIYIHISPGI